MEKTSRMIPPTPVAAPWKGSTAEGWLWLSILNTTACPSPMSITPAPSPGPCRTRGPSIGKAPEKRLGVFVTAVFRPHHAVDARLRPVGQPAETADHPLVFLIGQPHLPVQLPVADPLRTRLPAQRVVCLGCTALPPIFQHRSEESHSVRRTHPAVDRPFRMGHHAEHIPLPVDDPGDVVHRTVRVFPGVAEDDLIVSLNLRQGFLVAVIVSLAVGDGDADRLPLPVIPGEGEAGRFPPAEAECRSGTADDRSASSLREAAPPRAGSESRCRCRRPVFPFAAASLTPSITGEKRARAPVRR